MIIGLKKNYCGRMCGGNFLIKLKEFSKLHHQLYMSHDRRRISQLQTSALERSVAKLFTDFRYKVVHSLLWFGFETNLAYGPCEKDLAAICCWELFTAVTNVLEKNFVRNASPDSKILCR